MTRAPLIVGAMIVLAQSASAQQWKDIGKTAAGNVVSVNLKSVKREKDLVTATVRAVFTPPVKAARGTWASSQTTATFDCTKKKLAAKKNVYYADVKGTKEVERSVNKEPGYGVALGGTLAAVALEYLCKPQ